MIIIGFTDKTTKILPRIFCRTFRHVAVIAPSASGFIMYQFVHRGRIAKIPLQSRDLGILQQHGWVFIKQMKNAPLGLEDNRAFTCVQLAKFAIGMRSVFIQTPYALYKKIRQ